ncbi:MAG: Crp/Fnr family transcriptional regulator [Archangium sp.]
MDRFAHFERTASRIAQMPQVELREFFASGREVKLQPEEAFVRLGEREHRVGFIHRGLVRYQVTTADGKDVTKDFGLSGTFTGSFGSALLGIPSQLSIIALEDCELTVWPWDTVRSGFERGAQWERFGRRIAELLYVRKEQRELDFLLRSAAERYADAVKLLGPAVTRIPQYHLASYLGIAPESLSRLKRKK